MNQSFLEKPEESVRDLRQKEMIDLRIYLFESADGIAPTDDGAQGLQPSQRQVEGFPRRGHVYDLV